MLPEAMKGLGGSNEVLQFMSKREANEQPVPIPMPNGYGTVTLPHLLWQLGLVLAEASVRHKSKGKKMDCRDILVRVFSSNVAS